MGKWGWVSSDSKRVVDCTACRKAAARAPTQVRATRGGPASPSPLPLAPSDHKQHASSDKCVPGPDRGPSNIWSARCRVKIKIRDLTFFDNINQRLSFCTQPTEWKHGRSSSQALSGVHACQSLQDTHCQWDKQGAFSSA